MTVLDQYERLSRRLDAWKAMFGDRTAAEVRMEVDQLRKCRRALSTLLDNPEDPAAKDHAKRLLEGGVLYGR